MFRMGDRRHRQQMDVDDIGMDDSSSGEEDVDRDERVDVVDMDSPFEEDPEEDRNGNASDAQSFDGDGGSENGEDADDALTWDTMSEASEKEVQPADDEWYPLTARAKQLPNFGLPTTTTNLDNQLVALIQKYPTRFKTPSPPTPHHHLPFFRRVALNPPSQSASRSTSPFGSQQGSEDFDFADFDGVMRPEPTRRELAKLVLDYFLHNGHAEVIPTFCKEMNIPLPQQEIEEMNERNEIRDLICEGKIEEAIARIPPIIMESEDVNFVIRQQHIIEMIRAGQTTEPVLYFRKYMMEADGSRPSDDKMQKLERVFALMVFDKEDVTEFHVHFDQKEREATAKLVNSAILAEKGKSKSSQIELLAKTMVYTQYEQTVKHPNHVKDTTKTWCEKFFATPFG
ncbi:hypothetical protein CAEBREN_14978 [Caenorhabditis brenneri]|uniref:CTLH domain-containing protein n=1 Tax=Caenorhabditis brenneri TaxID=135651 RepID=G0M991_CAEBE|nr:hypothetical protein CAEBREN_14978 [Caenorhabditis brenneri]